jgi:type VI secretion system protein ImpB
MGDFAGDPSEPLKPLAERKFVQIDRDNFNDVMARIAPGLNLKVQNTLAGDGSEMAVNLKFRSMDDFEPAKVAEQVPALKALLDTRAKLRDLMSKVDRSEELEGLLEEVLQDKQKLASLSAELACPRSSKQEAERMSGTQTAPAGAATHRAEAGLGLLDQVIGATKQTERDRAQELIKALTEEALKGTVTFSRNLTRPSTGASPSWTASSPSS